MSIAPSFSQRASPRSVMGFTVIELMVVVAITAILAGLAAPSFIDSFRRFRVDTVRDVMQGSITLARIEAVRTSQPVVIRRNVGCGVLLANEWNCGWQVFVDTNGDNILNGADRQIQLVEGQNQTVIRKANVVNPDFLVLDRLGNITQFGQRFEFFPTGLTAAQGQLLCFTTGTRVRVVRNASACP
jgi:type IV fimbrial biogenesis protein FimT